MKKEYIEYSGRLSIYYPWDECRRPRRDAPAAIQGPLNTKKHSRPAVPRRGPEAGVLRIQYAFHWLEVCRIDSCPQVIAVL